MPHIEEIAKEFTEAKTTVSPAEATQCIEEIMIEAGAPTSLARYASGYIHKIIGNVAGTAWGEGYRFGKGL